MKDKNITFGSFEIAAVFVNTICARSFLNYPRTLVESSGNAAWIEMIFITALVLLYFFITSKLYSKFPGKDLIDLGDYVGGTFGRLFSGISVIILLIAIGTLILREYGENMKVVALENSPISFVMMFFLAGMIISNYAGIEAIVRLCAIMVPVIIVTYLIVLIGPCKYYDSTFFYPILGNGPYKIITDGFIKVSIYASIIYLFLFQPYIKKHEYFKRAGYMAIGMGAFIFLAGVIVFIAVFPYYNGIEIFLPNYELARLIYFGRFFQRIESVFVITWAASGIMYLSTILFFTVSTFQKTFKLTYYKPMILPFCVIFFSLSIIPPNLMTAITLETKQYLILSLVIAFLIPLALLILSNIKMHSKGRKPK